MGRILAMIYSVLCYTAGMGVLTAFIFFIGDYFIPVSVNKASPLAPNLAGVVAMAWNIGLVVIWGLQHSVMADPRFKTRFQSLGSRAVERSSYVLMTAIFTAALMAFWVPLPHVFWDVSGSAFGIALTALFAIGWTITVISTFLINHFNLFGLEQAYRYATGTSGAADRFRTPLFYKMVRHPMMTGVLIALWAAPTLTLGRLLFNIAMTVYIWVGVSHEEKTLKSILGEPYEDYQRTTPKLIPGMKP